MSTSGAEQQNHKDTKAEIEGIESWEPGRRKTMISNIKAASGDPAKIQKELAAFADELQAQILALGVKWGLKDLVYEVLDINEILNTIDGQIRELRKHFGEVGVTGDGHSNSAWAAEQLGWRHAGGQLHEARGLTAERVLGEKLTKLDMIEASHGIPLSKEHLYIEGKKELADTILARTAPRVYLTNKGLLKAFGIT